MINFQHQTTKTPNLAISYLRLLAYTQSLLLLLLPLNELQVTILR